MSEVLVEVTRGPIVECIHRGDVAVVNADGKLLYYTGDAHKLTYMRSAAKPLQALEVVLSGAADRFNFTDKELSVMCASHYGEEFHLNTVESILKKLGLDKGQLLCGTTTSLNPEYALKLANLGTVLTPVYNNCSGKHSGMLAVCVQKGYSLEDYTSPVHPVQIEMKNIISYMCKIDVNEIVVGTDGCTVPVFGMPLYNMALGFARLANPEKLAPEYKKAAERIFTAMNNSPEMVAGTNGFCSELMRITKGKLVAKLGAEGVYCIGVKGMGIGIALKIEDGGTRALSPAAMQALEDLNILTEEEKELLKNFKIKDNRNNVKAIVGQVKPAYHLTKA